MKLKINTLFIIFIISMLTGNGFPDEKNGKTEAFVNEDYIDEPVFKGTAYIHESGKKNAPSVILVHGVGADASNIWKSVAPDLEKEYHVIYFDLPGYGRSEKQNVLYSPKNYAMFIKWVYDKYCNGPMFLVGHSLGGAVSLYYAGTYPETVRRLILADAAGILHKSALINTLAKSEIEKYSSLPVIKGQTDFIYDIIQATLEKTEKTMPKDISLVLESYYLRKVFGEDANKVSAAALINTDFSIPISSVRSDVFLIWGEADPIAPLRTGKMLYSGIPGSSLNIMRGLGHCPMIDDPDGFNDLLQKCLSAVPEKREKTISKVPKTKNIMLDQKENITIEGSYATVKLTNCKNIKIINSDINSLEIKDSDVRIETSSIKSDTFGLLVSGSTVSVTGGSIAGSIAISSDNSKLDIAGVRLEGKKSIAEETSDKYSTIIFSVCKIKYRNFDRFIHDMIEISKTNPL